MASRRSSLWPILSAAVAAFLVVVALPSSWKAALPSFLRPDFHLGLDLAGGTQLDFRISEDELREQLNRINAEIASLEAESASPEVVDALRNQKLALEEQQRNVVEAIRVVLERRVNALGVSEATITPSYIGDEKHLLVECPGIIDTQVCIDTVGKTIQLEFKEEFTEATAEYEASIRAKAKEAVSRLQGSGITLAVLGEDLGDELGVAYSPRQIFFRDQLPEGLEGIWQNPQVGTVQEVEASLTVTGTDAEGQPVEEKIPGIFLVEALSPRAMTGRLIQEAPVAFGILAVSEENTVQTLQENAPLDDKLPVRVISTIRSMKPGELQVIDMQDGTAKIVFLRLFTPGREEVEVSHILVTYQGANAADASVTRTKEEALQKAEDLKEQLAGGASFEELARAQSDGPSKQNAGKLGVVTRGQLVPSFEEVAFANPTNFISDPVETPFGYHVIRVDKAAYKTPDTASFDVLTVTGENAVARAREMLAKLQAGQVLRQEEAIVLRSLFFSLKPTGWKDTPLDGKHFRSATVSLDPTTNFPIVQIAFDEEGGKLFQELTKRNVGKSIAIFVGGQLVSAPTVQQEIAGGTAVITGSQNIQEARQLAQDLNTGAIPAPIHLSGQRTVEPTLGAEALETSVIAGIVGMIVLMIYMFVAYRFLGILANLSLFIYAVLFLALLKLPLFLFSNQFIVLTLAGAAGLILSIGMAVDTNVLVFERVKEELKKGKTFRTAIETGFEKAWPSIRDSNISTIITCTLLFMIGTSIVRGFAVTLGLGVVISMFTGMVITRWIARQLADKPVATRMAQSTTGTAS